MGRDSARGPGTPAAWHDFLGASCPDPIEPAPQQDPRRDTPSPGEGAWETPCRAQRWDSAGELTRSRQTEGPGRLASVKPLEPLSTRFLNSPGGLGVPSPCPVPTTGSQALPASLPPEPRGAGEKLMCKTLFTPPRLAPAEGSPKPPVPPPSTAHHTGARPCPRVAAPAPYEQ